MPQTPRSTPGNAAREKFADTAREAPEAEQPEDFDAADVLRDARQTMLWKECRIDGRGVTRLHREDPEALSRLLVIGGLRALQEDDPVKADRLLADMRERTPGSLTRELVSALERATLGDTPGSLSPETAKAFARLQGLKLKNGERANVQDILSSDRYTLKTKMEVWERLVEPRLEELREQDTDLRESETPGFKPSMDDGAKETLNEEDIEMRVEPYRGGYYREEVYGAYDAATNTWRGAARTLRPVLPPEDEAALAGKKRYVFRGVFRGQRPVPLPEGAVPVPKTLDHAKAVLLRDEKGIVYVAPKRAEAETAETPFSFEFVVDPDAKLRGEPTEEERAAFADGRFSEAALKMLDEVRASGLSPLAKARLVRKFVTTTLTYSMNGVKSEEYHAAGRDYFRAIATGGEADCDVSNTYFIALLREVGIPAVMETGYFATKDKRFDFTALAGTRHAWTRVYDETTGEWRRMDATPPKEEEEKEEDDGENESGRGGGDDRRDAVEYDEDKDAENGDFEELEALSAEELSEAIEELRKDPEKTPQQRAVELYERKEGVSFPELLQYRSAVEAVSSIRNPETGKTISEEYQELFEYFVKTRRKTKEVFGGPVRQSEGDDLVDPVTAFIDVRSGSDDPLGYVVRQRKIEYEHIVTDVEDDQIIDLTESMEQNVGGVTILGEQRKMLIVHLEELARLDEKLRESAARDEIETPLGVRSGIMAFRGNRIVRVKDPDAPLTEKERCVIYRELETTKQGRGDLLGALQAYRKSITDEKAVRIKEGKLSKILTVYSDGNMYCTRCSEETCGVYMDENERRAIVKTVKELRGMGVVVHGIGFTENAQDIKKLCAPEGEVVADVRTGVMARHKLLQNHFRKL